MSLTSWADQLGDALGVELDLDVDAILELARDAAHAVERPAAPLTTFLVGYAAAMRGGSSDDVTDCIDVATDLIENNGE
ncbi:MAG: DUF6457 domain-containing protein [Nocardioidaceae bacterium]|jgi:hypothetical protein